MNNINTSMHNTEELQDPSVLKQLFPNSDRNEIKAIREIVTRIVALQEFALLSKQSSVKILTAIKAEWKEEFERSGRRIQRNILEKIRAVYELKGLRGLQLRPMLVPVTIAAILVIFSYLPEVMLPFNMIAGKTITSFSAAATVNLLQVGGIIAIVAVGLLILISRNSKS